MILGLNISRKTVNYTIPINKGRVIIESIIKILDILYTNMSEIDSNVALDYNEYRRKEGRDTGIHYTQQSQKTTSSIYNRISSLRNKIKENASITAEDINELVSIIDYINSKA